MAPRARSGSTRLQWVWRSHHGSDHRRPEACAIGRSRLRRASGHHRTPWTTRRSREHGQPACVPRLKEDVSVLGQGEMPGSKPAPGRPRSRRSLAGYACCWRSSLQSSPPSPPAPPASCAGYWPSTGATSLQLPPPRPSSGIAVLLVSLSAGGSAAGRGAPSKAGSKNEKGRPDPVKVETPLSALFYRSSGAGHRSPARQRVATSTQAARLSQDYSIKNRMSNPPRGNRLPPFAWSALLWQDINDDMRKWTAQALRQQAK
jgi:hypothetical protein